MKRWMVIAGLVNAAPAAADSAYAAGALDVWDWGFSLAC